MNLDETYLSSISVDHKRKFAQFFTPPQLAKYMVEWIIQINPSVILDPSFGTGIFSRYIDCNIDIIGYDLDDTVINYIKPHLGGNINLKHGDFLYTDIDETYDAVIANPPYLTSKKFENSQMTIKEISNRNDIKLSGMTNLYGLFVIEGCRRLKENGRAAFIIPTEWTNANYGTEIKKFLLENSLLKKIHYIDNKKLPFSDALTTACILFIEKKQSSDTIEVIYDNGNTNTHRFYDTNTLMMTNKWDGLFKESSVIPNNYISLGDVGRTRRGMATGANSFFHINQQTVNEWNLSNSVIECVGKVDTMVVNDKFIEDQKNKNQKIWLFKPTDVDKSALSYIRYGESLNLHQRYITRMRNPWYICENLNPPSIFVGVFGRSGIRFSYNERKTIHLTNTHGLYIETYDEVFIKALVVILNSSIVQKNLSDVLRVYGGGLIKLEPKDILDIKIPNITKLSDSNLHRLSNCLDLFHLNETKNYIDDIVRSL
ncbi:MAG: N-6 DNA methylase [Candidimonas sp.]